MTILEKIRAWCHVVLTFNYNWKDFASLTESKIYVADVSWTRALQIYIYIYIKQRIST